MPTVLRVIGLRFVVYPSDQSPGQVPNPPAHVHVIGPGWVVVVNLRGPAVRQVVGPCAKRDARRVLDLAAEHRAALLEAWGRFHG